MEKLNAIGMTLEEMESVVQSLGQPRYRADQLFNWIYKKRIASFDEMSNFSKLLRERLKDFMHIGHVHLIRENASSDKSTAKFLFQLQDGFGVESVFMIEGNRRTVCLSSQVGCALSCDFCATGTMGFQRNLSAGEIVDQLIFILRYRGTEATNVVIMGMGEPFLNYDPVLRACHIIAHDKGIAIGKRKITISTSGIVPAIQRFTDEGHGFKLAISLNAASDAIRSQLMPINKKYPLPELINAAKYYSARAKNRITFEYVLIAGLNDMPEEAQKLKRMLCGFPCKINIIPFNSYSGSSYSRPSEDKINEFIKPFLHENIVVSVRRSKGDDIDAACGQLYSELK